MYIFHIAMDSSSHYFQLVDLQLNHMTSSIISGKQGKFGH